MKITIIYDNTTFASKLKPDWGFAAFIETEYGNILFDTGADGEILMHNMREMSINPKSADIVFISHHHFDHIGGLSHFLRENPSVTIYAPPMLRGIKKADKVIYVEAPVTVVPTVYSTGELKDIEQSLCVQTDKGMAVIVGCSHPGVQAILDAAKKFGQPTWLIGGFHGFDNYDILKPLKLICPTHCTQHQVEILKLYPDTAVKGGAGKEIII